MISRTGEREELPRSPRGPCPPSALPSSPPISAGLEGASIHAADGAISKESVHGEFAPISLSEMVLVLGIIDKTPTVSQAHAASSA